MMSVGKRLKTARGCLKQKQLAQQAGVSQAVISQIEKGRHAHPRAEILVRLERALNLPHGHLTRDDGNDPSFEKFLQSDYAKDAVVTDEEIDFLPTINWKNPEDEAPPWAWAKLLSAVRGAKKFKAQQGP